MTSISRTETATGSRSETRLGPQTVQTRYWEIDALRGVAIVMMIIYHLMWDFWYYQVLPDVVLYAGFWKYFQRATANLFLALVGVSLAVVTMRRLAKTGGTRPPFRPYLWRGLRVFGWGMVLSAGVWIVGIGYIHFGVLHLIGFATIAAYPFLRLRWTNLIAWAVFFIAGYFLLGVSVDFPWLLWLGLPPHAYYPNDYFPVIPYFGVVLLGIFLGNTLYTRTGRRFSLPDLSRIPPLNLLGWMGRQSLIIYLVHQPLLFAILWALGVIRF